MLNWVSNSPQLVVTRAAVFTQLTHSLKEFLLLACALCCSIRQVPLESSQHTEHGGSAHRGSNDALPGGLQASIR